MALSITTVTPVASVRSALTRKVTRAGEMKILMRTLAGWPAVSKTSTKRLYGASAHGRTVTRVVRGRFSTMARLIKLYKVLICGDRNRKPYYKQMVRREIRRLKEEHGSTRLLLIAGGAPGVDTLVKEIGKEENVHVAEIDALWDTRNRGAGSQRNIVMASLYPHEIIGIHSEISDSRGTKGMLDLAEEHGIPWKLVKF